MFHDSFLVRLGGHLNPSLCDGIPNGNSGIPSARLESGIYNDYDTCNCRENGLSLKYELDFRSDWMQLSIWRAGNEFETGCGERQQRPPGQVSPLKGSLKLGALYHVDYDVSDPFRWTLAMDTCPFELSKIYYAVYDDAFWLSNEFRLIQERVPFCVDKVGLYSYFWMGHVMPPRTVNSNIKRIPPGMSIRAACTRGMAPELSIVCRKPLDINIDKTKLEHGYDPYTDRDVDVLNLLTESIAKEFGDTLNSEPVLFLSGGVDSALAGYALKKIFPRPYRAVTIVSNPFTAEAERASLVAGTIGLDHQMIAFDTDGAAGFLPKLWGMYDVPVMDPASWPTAYALSMIVDEYRDQVSRIKLVDGTGADLSWGFKDLKLKYLNIALTGPTGRLARSILRPLISEFPAYLSKLTYFVRGGDLWLTHSGETLSTTMIAREDRELCNTVETEVANWFHSVFRDCEQWPYGLKVSVTSLVDAMNRCCCKSLSPARACGADIVFPYLIREVLEPALSIPLPIKFKDGIVKWPIRYGLAKCEGGTELAKLPKGDFVLPMHTWVKKNREAILEEAGSRDSLIRDLDINWNYLRGVQGQRAVESFWSLSFLQEWAKTNLPAR